MTARIIKKWMILLLAVAMLISIAPLNVSASASASETDKTYQAYDASQHRKVISENGTTDSEWSLCMDHHKQSPGKPGEATGEYSKNENATKDTYASNGGKGNFQKIKRMLFYKLKHPELNYTVLQNEYYYQQDNKTKIYDTHYSQDPELNKQKQDLRTFAEDSSHDDEINSIMEVFIYKSINPKMQNLISAKLKEVPTSTKVKFSKKALTENGEDLKGATIQLTKEDGSLVKKWVTDGTVTEFELKDGKYTFTETSAPAKYQVATAITFEVKNGKAIVKGIAVTGNTIVMVDKLKEVPTPPSTLPKTGESSSLGAFLSALGLSLAGLVVLYKKMKACE
ncbi:MAG: LPXTG cell wall anchor domain-containing protein [Clostridiales bacterium]|nr:LPXTG cell wall anchor domain-containing protein [Clostridiales bacterium]